MTLRTLNFKAAKERVLICMYEVLLADEGVVWLSGEEIVSLVAELPRGYVQKALDSLLAESLVEYEGGNYSIEEQAILLVEQKLISRGDMIPSADGLVSLDHNQPKVREIDSAFESLEDELKGNNEAFSDAPEERAVAIAEVAAMRRLWNEAYLRVEAFKVRSQSVLTWIYEKAAATAITEACKHLIKLILGW